MTRFAPTRWLRGRGGNGGETERALAALRDFILRHGSSRFRNVDDESEGKIHNLAGYRDRTQRLFHFTDQGFREACAGHDHRMVARVLAEKGFLQTREANRLTTRITIHGFGRIRLYTVTAAVLDEDDVLEGDLVHWSHGPATSNA